MLTRAPRSPRQSVDGGTTRKLPLLQRAICPPMQSASLAARRDAAVAPQSGRLYNGLATDRQREGCRRRLLLLLLSRPLLSSGSSFGFPQALQTGKKKNEKEGNCSRISHVPSRGVQSLASNPGLIWQNQESRRFMGELPEALRRKQHLDLLQHTRFLRKTTASRLWRTARHEK